MNHLQPVSRLAAFFERNTKFVDEVSLAFRTTCLFVMSADRCPGVHDLAGDVSASRGLAQGGGHTNDPHCKVEQPIGQFVTLHALA